MPFGKRIDVGDGLRLHVVGDGPKDGPPVILLHGFPESWWAWRKQIAPLAERGFLVIAPDLRGYGDSAAPEDVASYGLDRLAGDIIGIADALGVDRFDLVGHDWGGIVAWAVAGHYPNRVRRLVAIAAPHPDTMRGQLLRHPRQWLRSSYIAFFQLRGLPERMLRARDFRRLRDSLVKSSRPGTFSTAELDRYTAAWRRPGRLTAMLNYYRALRRKRAPVGQIAAPTLILWGEGDRFLGTHLAEASGEMCTDAAVLYRPDATHWLHLEEPEWLTDQIASFLSAPR
jgi:pimeloyl-ACP methyl ester carboxylesterase